MRPREAVDGERLRADIEANAAFGAVESDVGPARTTLTGTTADRRVRERFVDRLRDADCAVRVDGVGNVVGRWTPPSADPDAAPVAAGSHLDSVVEGGIFDGALGAYGALEAVRALRESDAAPGRPVDVVSFTEEEGVRFGTGVLGSSVAAGLRDAETALSRTDEEGTTLGAALEEIGFRGTDDVDASEWDAWVELHVEQDTTLVEAGADVGVVEAISGLTNCRAEVTGAADHAGATPMAERRDALAAAATFVTDLERAANEAVATGAETAVGTVGAVDVAPNANNTVPGEVRMVLDLRAVDAGTIDRLVERARASLARVARERPVETTLERYRDTPPASMADRCVAAAETGARAAGLDGRRMHSPAMHDTANVSRVTDAGLLFAPSEGGHSHSPREWTDWEDCADAVRALAATLADLSTR